MAFLKRLGFYLFGLSIGLVFLVFFLKKKSEKTGAEFCYFPNCRVLKDMRSKPMHYSDDVKRQLQDGVIDSMDIASFLHEGDIDFRASDTKSEPCKTYVIETELEGREAVMRIRNCTQKVAVENVSL